MRIPNGDYTLTVEGVVHFAGGLKRYLGNYKGGKLGDMDLLQ
mgnify:CR=1 FL=1